MLPSKDICFVLRNPEAPNCWSVCRNVGLVLIQWLSQTCKSSAWCEVRPRVVGGALARWGTKGDEYKGQICDMSARIDARSSHYSTVQNDALADTAFRSVKCSNELCSILVM